MCRFRPTAPLDKTRVFVYTLSMARFYEEMENILSSGSVEKLLLHSCCAPCSSSVLEVLTPKTNVTVYYYNPNIMPYEEYAHRIAEQRRLCELLSVPLIEGEYDNDNYLCAVRGLENAPEGGDRCEKCFYLRLLNTANEAKKGGFDHFCTTLTVSPHKNADVINALGYEVSKQTGVEFLPSDFKKRNGFLRSIRLSEQYDLYRQVYCGCRF